MAWGCAPGVPLLPSLIGAKQLAGVGSGAETCTHCKRIARARVDPVLGWKTVEREKVNAATISERNHWAQRMPRPRGSTLRRGSAQGPKLDRCSRNRPHPAAAHELPPGAELEASALPRPSSGALTRAHFPGRPNKERFRTRRSAERRRPVPFPLSAVVKACPDSRPGEVRKTGSCPPKREPRRRPSNGDR
jgi:hypothetical protein